ncbi:hypothetical protein CPC16_007506 [Podila verticillata]|nr:hypothetical protein BGZ59_004946 [Podila verticillata]KAF9386465.1 hypothetical protein CPC16_007506 [Podila verticillata]KFH71544.1 hypothetical protein MVEG_01842 [Podila verticillata NRRL 6337]
MMDIDITPFSLPYMPENIWLDIFSYLSLEEKFNVAGTCRTWHRILEDPSLYTHITLDNMEFNTLVLCMKQLCRFGPRIRSFRISNCFSHFISKTTVPVQNSSIVHHFPQSGMHSLYSHITSFTLARRREEYRKLGFTLHEKFSRYLVALLEYSDESLRCLEIHDNFLDLEMTELVFCIVRYGRHLEHLLYDGNKDGGFIAPEVVSAITAACPNIKSFRGQHAISDTVLRRMMTGWEDLQSITLAPYQSSDGTKEVSLEGLWSLLEHGKVETLEILDLQCISNENVQTMVNRAKHIRSMRSPVSSPLAHPFSHHAAFTNSYMAAPLNPIPGESLRHLTLTKYTSTPLTLPGFASLLKLFPNLESFSFTTNFFTYDYQFQGLTKDIYEEEIAMVNRLVQTEMTDRLGLGRFNWMGEWHAAVTEEQRLRAGIMRSG